MTDLPRNGTLLGLAKQYSTDTALANHLGVPRETLRDHIYRIGMREAVNAVRDRPEVVRPDEIPIIHRDYTSEEKHYVYPLGDLHIGARMHNREMWEAWLEYLEDRKNTSLLGTGDFLNTALKDSKSDVYDETLRTPEAKRLLRRQLTPLAEENRIDGLAPGNHEDRITRSTGDCPILDVADSLGVPYVQASALFVYHVGDQEYEVYLRHGTGNGQSLASLAKSQLVVRADCYVTGHIHRQATTTEDVFERNRSADRVERRKMYFVSSGSFLGYEKYAAVRGYSPGRLGAPRIFLDGRRRDLHISL